MYKYTPIYKFILRKLCSSNVYQELALCFTHESIIFLIHWDLSENYYSSSKFVITLCTNHFVKDTYWLTALCFMGAGEFGHLQWFGDLVLGNLLRSSLFTPELWVDSKPIPYVPSHWACRTLEHCEHRLEVGLGLQFLTARMFMFGYTGSSLLHSGFL